MQSASEVTETAKFSTKKTLLSLLLTVNVIWLHTRLPSNSPKAFSYFVQQENSLAARCVVMTFFVISGYFFGRGAAPKTLHGKLRRRMQGLLAPYLAWNLLYTFFYHAQEMLSGTYRWKALFFDVVLYRAHSPAWYILYLLVFAALGMPIYFVMRRRLLGGAVLMALPAAQMLLQRLGLLPEGLRLDGCFYYLAGCWLALHARHFVETPSRRKSMFAVCALAGCALAAAVVLRLGADSAANAALVGCWLCLWFVLDAIPLQPLPRSVGGLCFLCYMAHTFVLEQMACLIAAAALPGPMADLLAYAGGACAVFGVCWLLQHTLCRIPAVGLVLSGGRTRSEPSEQPAGAGRREMLHAFR